MSLRQAAQRYIARHRRSGPIERAHRVARFFENAYNNVGTELAESGEVALLERLRPLAFATVLDVGANVGGWTMAALEAWPAAEVHAFEVAPETFGHLQAAMALPARDRRVVLNNYGLGSRTGIRDMFYYPQRSELTGDVHRHTSLAVSRFEAQIVSGDDYVARTPASARIDFLKVDVEGAEYAVLEGFAKSLSARTIRCVQFEHGAFSIDTRILLRDYYEMLSPGYLIGKIFPDHVEFRDYSWMQEDFRFANFLCVSRDDPEAKRLAEGTA